MFTEILIGNLTNFCLVIVGVLLLHYIFLLWNSDYWEKRGVFCPDSKLLLGNLPGQVNGKRNVMYEVDELYKKYKDQHGYIGIYKFRQPYLLVFDPEVIKTILIKYFKHFQGTELYGKIDSRSDPLFGNHPFFLAGDEWKTKRLEMSPAFTSTRIKAIFPVAQCVIAKMIKFINQEIVKEDFDGIDAKDLASRFTISIVSNSIYNVDPKTFEGEDSEILKRSRAVLKPSKRFMITAMLTTIYPFLGKYLKLSFAQSEAQNFFVGLMKDATQYREENNIKLNDVLDHLMSLRNKNVISDIGLATHCATFLINGFDTSSSGISSALMELGKHKIIQDKLRRELFEAMPSDEDVTFDAVMDLPYLEQVWNETLRLHSPASYLGRCCTEPVEVVMPNGKKLSFEKGSVVLIPINSLHLDPDYFPNSKNFDPDRFSPENGGAKSYNERCIFLPFGTGPRMCNGIRHADAQSKLAIAALIRNFEVSINPKSPKEYAIHPQALLVTLEGCCLDFKPHKVQEKDELI